MFSQSSERGLAQWMMNSEAISDEIVRQARYFSSRPPSHDLDFLQRANMYLRSMLIERFHSHAADLESFVILQVLSLVNHHILSPPMDLFNNLVPATTSQTSTKVPLVSHSSPTDTLHPQPSPFTDLSNRITHILLLHWRIWGPIAYVQDEKDHISASDALETNNSSTTATSSPPPPPRVLPPPPADTGLDASVVAPIEPPDTGQEALEYAPPPPSYQ
jgi:hypothetical protein